MKKSMLAASLAAALGVSAPALADDAPAAPAAPSLGAVLAATPGLSLTGYVASTYTHFDTSTVGQRQFDLKTNGFTLNQASVTASYLPSSGAGASVTLLGGDDASYLAASAPQVGVATAYAQYAVGALTVMAGRLPTLAGAEVVNPVANNEISRSLLFYDLEPIYHDGLRASYAVSGALTLTGGVSNGINYSSNGTADSKLVELGASGAPTKQLSYSLAYYYAGTNSYYGGAPGKTSLLDFVGTYNATDALSLGLNIDLLSKDLAGSTKKSNGYALYANYALTGQLTLSGRGEYLTDDDGLITGSANKIKELTVALNYTPVQHLKLAAELRQAKADNPLFADGATTTTKQNSFELMAAYSF